MILEKNVFLIYHGGQQQRALLARALCATKKIIILDEPTNGLDPKVAKQIYELLKKLQKEDNITIIMVSHDIEKALKYADNVIELEDGKIVFNDKPQDYKTGGAK